MKYVLPSGVNLALDVNPFVRSHVLGGKLDLFVTESPIKADCLIGEGYAAVGLCGVWGWCARDRNVKGERVGKSRPLADWNHIPLSRRGVTIIFDSDVSTNENVLDAAVRLYRFLRSRGANPITLRIPPLEDGGKQGIDDLLASGGRVSALEPFTSRGAEEALERAKGTLSGNSLVVARYILGRMVKNQHDRVVCSYRRIAAETGLNIPAIQRAVPGVLSILDRKNNRNRLKGSLWTVK